MQIIILDGNEYFNLSEIYNRIALSSNGRLTKTNIRETIRYAIDHRDENKTIENFEIVFGYEYDEDIFRNKDFITELMRLFLIKFYD